MTTLLVDFLPSDLAPAALVLAGLVLGLAGGLAAVALVRQDRRKERGRRGSRSQGLALADLIEISADWVWETDAQGRFIRFSDGLSEASGELPHDYLSHTMTDIEFRTDDPATLERYFVAVTARKPFRNFLHYVERGGQRHYRRVSGKPVFSPEGKFLGYRGVTVDATAEARAAEEAKSIRHLLAEAIESISEGFALFDTDDRLVLYNNRARGILGLGPEPRAGLGQRFADMLAHAVRSRHLQTSGFTTEEWIAARLERHRRAEGASEHLLGDGSWYRVSERRTRDGGIVIIYTDISEDKRREAEIRRQGALLQTTFDNMADGILVADRDLKIVAWNRRYVELMKPAPELLARPDLSFADLILWQSQRGDYGKRPPEKILAAAEAILKNDAAVEYERIQSDGTVLHRRLQPLPGGGIVSIYNDVTRQRQAETSLRLAKEQAEGAARAKSEFLANMSHELRTPLNAIIGFSEIIRDQILGPLGSERYLEYARDINDSGRHLLGIINDILDISKAEAGRLKLHEEAVDATQLIESCLRLMRDQVERARLTLTATLAPGLLLFIDARKIRQVLLNLLSNACKFTPAGGRIEIQSALAEDGGALLRVRDSGIGMAQADIPRVLEAFAQVDGALNRRHEGTGLGLPLCKMLIELHEGTLAIESVPERGTLVTLNLPSVRVMNAPLAPGSLSA